MTDVTYLNQGLFTTFFPQTPAGETAWRTMAATKGGECGTVLTVHLVNVIRQIRRAGLTVAAARKPTSSDLDAIMSELV